VLNGPAPTDLAPLEEPREPQPTRRDDFERVPLQAVEPRTHE
jgi:hypothetical protein